MINRYTILFALVFISASCKAQLVSYFFSDRFEHISLDSTAYKRSYEVKGKYVFVKDYEQNQLVMISVVQNTTSQEVLDAFIRYCNNDLRKYDYIPEFDNLIANFQYFENGKVEESVKYTEGILSYTQVFDDQGRQVLDVDGNGKLTQKGETRSIHRGFENAHLVEHFSVDNLSRDTIYFLVDEGPTPIGGLEKLYEILKNKIQYPMAYRRDGIQGEIYVEFNVKKDGSLDDFVCYDDEVPEFGAIVIRKLRKLEKWKPALINGKPVNVKVALPVIFKLTN